MFMSPGPPPPGPGSVSFYSLTDLRIKVEVFGNWGKYSDWLSNWGIKKVNAPPESKCPRWIHLVGRYSIRSKQSPPSRRSETNENRSNVQRPFTIHPNLSFLDHSVPIGNHLGHERLRPRKVDAQLNFECSHGWMQPIEIQQGNVSQLSAPSLKSRDSSN